MACVHVLCKSGAGRKMTLAQNNTPGEPTAHCLLSLVISETVAQFILTFRQSHTTFLSTSAKVRTSIQEWQILMF